MQCDRDIKFIEWRTNSSCKSKGVALFTNSILQAYDQLHTSLEIVTPRLEALTLEEDGKKKDEQKTHAPFRILPLAKKPTHLCDVGRYLKDFMLNVDACAAQLVRWIPVLFQEEAEEILQQQLQDKCRHSREYLDSFEEAGRLLHHISALPKECLYYIAARIVRQDVSYIEVLRFTLKPEYRKKVMEPESYSLRYHKFLEGLRECMASDSTASLEGKSKDMEKTVAWLNNHLVSVACMLQHAIFDNCNSDKVSNWALKRKHEMLVPEMLKSLQGRKRAIKWFAFRILDSSFVDLFEAIDPKRSNSSLRHIKEAYHFRESINAELELQGKAREKKITDFQALVALFKVGKGADAIRGAGYNVSAGNENTEDFSWARVQERETFRNNLLQSYFEILKREMLALMENADKIYKISSTLILPPIQRFIEMNFARKEFAYLELSHRESKLNKVEIILNKAPEEALYYLAHAIYNEHHNSRLYDLVISLRDARIANLKNNTYEKQRDAFIGELDRIINRDACWERDAVKLIQDCFIPIMKMAMEVSLWDPIRVNFCMKFVQEVLNCNSNERMISLVKMLRDTRSLLDIAVLVERRAKEEELKRYQRSQDEVRNSMEKIN